MKITGDFIPLPAPCHHPVEIQDVGTSENRPSLQFPRRVEDYFGETTDAPKDLDAADDELENFLLVLPVSALVASDINTDDIKYAHSTELQGLLQKEEFTFVP